MASLTRENGGWKIQFMRPDKKRPSIRLGKVQKRQAEAVKIRVEHLVAAIFTGHAVDDETARWVAGLDDKMTEKLANVGLIAPREVATLREFIDRYISGRVDIKPRTRMNLERIRGYLLDFFDADRPLRDFNAGDAEDFRLHLIGRGLAENTVRRAIGRSRQFFRAAMRRGLLSSNPFDGIAASV